MLESVPLLRALANSVLSFLLVTTLLFGGCISCEQYFMWPGVKSCCAPNGHCKTKVPAKQNTGPECKQIAFDHHDSFDLKIDLPASPAVKVEPSGPCARTLARWNGTNQVEPSPPDLQILNSLFLI